ncbi:stimulated by retinoic acid gene 6 protein homolog [Elysia marginata]|uniref:Stimulated by retinoic acid gene 6 protein homolog n=1 Tax=Elysia marginata TaxID=1093978 RepID=A0AAV4I406_9GAST|nr:stimulated by retinoic acid gene 6 protein homolog [Elysia marginata]
MVNGQAEVVFCLVSSSQTEQTGLCHRFSACTLRSRKVGFEVCAYSVSLFNMWLKSLRYRLNQVEETHLITPTNLTQRLKDVIDVGIDGISIFRVLVYISFVGAFILGLLNILASIIGYRSVADIGDHGFPFLSVVSSPEFIVGGLYPCGTALQTLYVFCFIIQSFVFVVISLLLTILILVFKCHGVDWFVDVLNLAWPIAIAGVVINFSQVLSVRFLFLQDRGNTLALTNRRFFFISTYFMFFYNIFMGVFSCLVRVVESLIFGLYLLPRLDHCIMPPSFRAIDPGYQAFIGFLLTESQHCHPVVLTFVHLVDIQMKHKRSQREDAGRVRNGSNLEHVVNEGDSTIQLTHFDHSTDVEDKQRKKELARFNWHLLFTLLNNPSVRMMRKGYVQAQVKAKALGLTLPVSDGLRTADVETIREQTMSYLAQLEAERERNKWKLCRHLSGKTADDKSVPPEIRVETVALNQKNTSSIIEVLKENSSGSEGLIGDVQGFGCDANIAEKDTHTNPII